MTLFDMITSYVPSRPLSLLVPVCRLAQNQAPASGQNYRALRDGKLAVSYYRGENRPAA